MSLRVEYESGLSGQFTDISDRYREYAFDVAQDAEEGSVATSSVTVDDPNGDLDITGWRRFVFSENAATGSNTLIANLYITDRTISRGPYVTGAGRQWVCSVVDVNTVLGFRVFTESNANRPAETDVARVQWMQSQLGTPGVPETEYVDTSGAVSMDAVDYRGQTRLSVLDDCAQASGKNYFVYTKDTGGGTRNLGLWYAHTASTMYTSPLRLTNVHSDIAGDATGNTFAIAADSELKRDPSRVYSGGYGQFDGGQVYEEDPSISAEFTRRDAIVPMENVKTAAKATARVLRYLDDFDTEEDRISTAVILPAAKVNFVREGMRVQFKANHLPGYESFEYLRVLQRKVKFNSEDPTQAYLVSLELASEGEVSLPPPGGPDLTYAICNTESGGIIIDREANGPDDTFDVSGDWYWELDNTQHDTAAYTEFLKLFYDNPSEQVIDLVAAMGGTGGPAGTSNLQHPADPGHCPYITLPSASGTFSVTSGLGFHFNAKSQGYSAPCSAPYVAECWELRLWRI